MKKIVTILISIILYSAIVYSQPITIEWQKAYGGTFGENANAIELTKDGGYIVAGTSGSINGDVTCTINSSHDWVIKLDSYGNIQWQNCYGVNYLFDIKKTIDSCFILGGLTYDSTTNGFHHGGAYDGLLIKIDTLGNVIWEKAYGGSDLDCIRTITIGHDGGYIIGGETNSNDGDLTTNNGDNDGWVMKLNSSGNVIWSNSYGGPGVGGEQIRGIITTKDSGFVAAGSSGGVGGIITSNHGLLDLWILKINKFGNFEWQKNYGGSDYDLGWSIAEKNSNGYIIAGKTYSNNFDVHGFKGSEDVWLLNLNSNGDTLWTKTYGGSSGDEGTVIKRTDDNNFIIGGLSQSNDGDVSYNHGSGYSDCWLFKIGLSGNILWEKSFGGSLNESISDVEQTNDGFIFCGTANSANGDLTINHGQEDSWIVKLADATVDIATIENETYMSIFPNPVINNITIKTSRQTTIEILNIQGQIIKTFYNAEKETIINLTNLPSGVYIIKAKTDKGITTKKFIKE